MNAIELNLKAMPYTPSLPDAESVMASLLYVATLFIKKPTLDLARLALRLSETLTLPEYAESELICNVSRRMCVHWTLMVNELEQANHG